METFVIYETEKGIEVPRHSRRMSQTLTNRLLSLEIGDSFFIKCEAQNKRRSVQSTVLAIAIRLKKEDKTLSFTTRKWMRNNEYGIRVWRIK
uniref:Uncharacterized protein n=1 Tax=viral metagenome TaxID=1070528 RepID=A0A6M3JQ62_9ZZZZ